MVCALVVPVVVMVVQCSHRMIRVVVTCNYVISHIVIDPTYQPVQSDGPTKKRYMVMVNLNIQHYVDLKVTELRITAMQWDTSFLRQAD